VVAGIRVGTDGIPFAGGPLALSDGSQDASNAAATSAGTRFLVAYATGSIQGRRVAIDGTLEDATPFLVSVNHNAMRESAAAFDGTNYLVSWADQRTQPVGPAPIAGVNVITGRVTVGATFDGTNYVVSFSNNGEALYSRVTPAGVVLDQGGQLAGNGYSARVASQRSDEASLVVWATDGGGVFARRVQAGHVEGDPITLSDTGGGPRPDVAFDGGPASDASSSPDAPGSGTNGGGGGCQAAQGPTSIATLPWILGVLLAVRRRRPRE
jgi:hypothetical protein